MTQFSKQTIFLAAPLASYTAAAAFQQGREGVLRVKAALEQSGYAVVYPGETIASLDEFDASHTAIVADYNALRAADYFLCLYLEPVLSSVLVEAGLALALEKPSVYFVRRRADLPFLLRGADQAFPTVKIYEVSDAGGIVEQITARSAALFSGAWDMPVD